MTAAVDPADPDCWYAAAAPLMKAHSRNSHARIYRWSADGWLAVTGELRELPHAPSAPAGHDPAGHRDGTIRFSYDREQTWDVLPPTDSVRALA